MDKIAKYTLLQAALTQLNAKDGLPSDFKGQTVLYRLNVVDTDFVKIEGFVPQSDAGAPVNVAQDFRNGTLWIAAQAQAFDDYVRCYDGAPAKLDRLNKPFREHRFEEFHILEERPVFGLLLPIEFAALSQEAALA
jgi:hypothetical protein